MILCSIILFLVYVISECWRIYLWYMKWLCIYWISGLYPCILVFPSRYHRTYLWKNCKCKFVPRYMACYFNIHVHVHAFRVSSKQTRCCIKCLTTTLVLWGTFVSVLRQVSRNYDTNIPFPAYNTVLYPGYGL